MREKHKALIAESTAQSARKLCEGGNYELKAVRGVKVAGLGQVAEEASLFEDESGDIALSDEDDIDGVDEDAVETGPGSNPRVEPEAGRRVAHRKIARSLFELTGSCSSEYDVYVQIGEGTPSPDTSPKPLGSHKRMEKQKFMCRCKKQRMTTPMGLEPIIFATGKQRLTIRPWCLVIR